MPTIFSTKELADVSSNLGSVSGNLNSVSGNLVNITIATLVSGSGLLTKPTFGTLGGVASPTVAIGPATGLICRTATGGSRRLEIWNYPGGNFTPAFSNGASQTATRLLLTADTSTENTTRLLKVVESSTYGGFSTTNIGTGGWFAALTRDTVTGNIDPALASNIANFHLYPNATSPIERFDRWYNGPKRISGFLPSGETSPFGGATGSYIRISSGSAISLGRNGDNDPFETDFVRAYPATQGAQTASFIARAGRAIGANEGYFNNVQSGASARIQLFYEPTPATVLADYVAIPAGQWTLYKLYYFLGSNYLALAANNITFTNTEFNNGDHLVAPHQYDSESFSRLDRWLSAIPIGYLALRSTFNPNAILAANAGLYRFYDTNKL